MAKNKLTIPGILYSVLSALVLPFLLLMQIFSAFLFDAPGSLQNIAPYIIALGILLIPVSLVAANIFMWIAIKKKNTRNMIIAMISPIVYTIVFFLLWILFDAS